MKKPMAKIRFRFGETAPDWPSNLRWTGPLLGLIFPFFAFAAITDHPNPELFITPDARSVLSVLTYGFAILQMIYFTLATFLIFTRKPVGIFMLLVGFTYAGMMLNALFIAAFVIGSWWTALGTVGLYVWSACRLRRINALVDEASISKIANLLVRIENNEVLLAYGEIEGHKLIRETLRKSSSGFTAMIELAGAFCIILVGPLLLPLGASGNLPQTSLTSRIIWGVCVFIFLAARGAISSWLLQMRALNLTNSTL